MRRRTVLLLAGLGFVVGVGAGIVLSPDARARGTGEARPAVVEKALRALDAYERRGDRSALERALADIGDRRGVDPSFRDEVELVAVVAAGDDAALWRFAVDGPPSPARARALLRLATAGGDTDRARATARFLADYPRAWAAPRLQSPR